MTDFPYMVIFPCGNRAILDVAYVRDYEKADWALASNRTFATEEDAKEYARKLSDEHGIPLAGERQPTLDGT